LLDAELTPHHVQDLADADAVAAFFQRLGYDTERRLQQSPANLGIAESQHPQIRRCELVADQLGLLQVYLFELKSVTQAAINALTRSFRNRVELFLLVLTSDYERLHFVLLERAAPEEKPGARPTPTQRQVTIHPRTLTVERRQPGRVALRVLRRMTYTEADPLAQFDKLLSAFTVAEWTEEHFNNRALFSDYFLKERLRDELEWQEDLKPAYLQVAELLCDVRSRFGGKSEDELRTGLLEPLFEVMGFQHKRQKPGKEDTPKPDYVLGPSRPFASFADVPCLTYCWARFLDGKDPSRDSDTPNENPGALVVSLLERGDADWAVVTNGKLWRLYSAKTHSRSTNYLEIDLEEAVAGATPEATDPEAFRYFWLLFRARAFASAANATAFEDAKGREGGKGQEDAFAPLRELRGSLLDRILDGSHEYAKELGERLKGRVFEQVFPFFARGFIDHAQRGGATVTDAVDVTTHQSQLQTGSASLPTHQVFQGTLTSLYRLLFVLYAEARDLLPVRERGGYFEHSLDRLKAEVAGKAGTDIEQVEARLSKAYSKTGTELYDRLSELFAAIDTGRPALNLPTYNGGLFLTDPRDDDRTDEARHGRFLRDHRIPDYYLACGLDLLARDEDPKTKALVFIDYKSLGVRQLGSIYEGLLEFRVRIAPETMAVVKGKKTEEVVPLTEARRQKLPILKAGRGKDAPERTLAAGTVYLENDRRERKATGSYYTPDYIVKYIIEHTVGPVLKEKFEQLAPRLREAQKAYRQRVKNNEAVRKQGKEPLPGHNPELVAQSFRDAVDELFDVKVLDPAMGSGHFLVEAVDFITDKTIDFLNGFPWNPVTATLRQTRETILAEMRERGIALNPARLTDINLLKRHVLKRCLYGVDLNPMAVELAKVSLWLDCFTLGAPLSFLDHHLKCGNSLIGVRDASALIVGGGRREELRRAIANYLTISSLTDTTSAQVGQSRTLFSEAERLVLPTKQRLNVDTAQYFVDLGSPASVSHVAQTAYAPNGATEQDAALFGTAQSEAEDRAFFHWQLEFPEVWYNAQGEKDNAGFDATVGNPPYVRAETADKPQRSYLMTAGQYDTLFGRFDVFLPFMERALRLLKDRGAFGMIVPGAALTINYCHRLRHHMLADLVVDSVVDVRRVQVFDDSSVAACVIVARNQRPGGDARTRVVTPQGPDGLRETKRLPQRLFLSLPDCGIRPEITAGEAEPKAAVDTVSIPMGGICYCITGLVGHDSNTGESIDRLIHDRAVDSSCKPYVEAKEWRGRYHPLEPERFIQYRAEMMHRPKFRELFESPKVVVQRLSSGDLIEATLDRDGVYVNHVLNCCTKLEDVLHLGSRLHVATDQVKPDPSYSLAYVLALVCSRVVGAYHNRYLSPGLDIFPETMRRLPIRRIHFTTPKKQREELTQQLVAQYDAGDHESLLAAVETLLPKGDDGQFLFLTTKERPRGKVEHSDVVHDLLAHLAQVMTDLNKQKQAETKRFLGDLEKRLKIQPKGDAEGLESLTGKTTLKNYLGDYQKGQAPQPFDALEDVLRKNKSRLAAPIADPALLARLRDDYEASLAKLLPIKEQLARTDWLIDQVVYRLYGLTEEEIAVVEGRGAA
jgi:hypothetical protein